MLQFCFVLLFVVLAVRHSFVLLSAFEFLSLMWLSVALPCVAAAVCLVGGGGVVVLLALTIVVGGVVTVVIVGGVIDTFVVGVIAAVSGCAVVLLLQ